MWCLFRRQQTPIPTLLSGLTAPAAISHALPPGNSPTQKLFIDGGLDAPRHHRFPHDIRNAYQSFMTGLFPGHAGILLARYPAQKNRSNISPLAQNPNAVIKLVPTQRSQTPYTTTQGSLFDHLPIWHRLHLCHVQSRCNIANPKLPFRAWNTFVL